MILVDTSVWIQHLRYGEPQLVERLETMDVLTHPFVVGELALGRLEQRDEILEALGNLPSATVATHEEILTLVDKRRLDGSGIGWVDAHLLAAALLSEAQLWTFDARLAEAAKDLGLLFH